MSVDRPTFHESWHRVADLRPRLRAGTRTSRQTSRGRVWQVVEDASGAQFFRMNEPAWRFIGLLDGRRTAGEAWLVCQDRLGDSAPTQGEAIQLLAQLYNANLLSTEVAGDTQTLFRRRKRRLATEARSTLMSLLFLRAPLWDPDAFLTRWSPLVAWLVSPLGAALWLVLLIIGAVHLAPRSAAFASGVSGVLAPSNLIYLYLTFAVIKGLHELGHGFASKAIGRRLSDPSGSAGSVHTMGIMFLVFLPVPYVDASSSWLFQRKAHRIAVASAGIVVELAIAAIAAVVWSRTAPGTLTNALAFNAVIIAGVSTIIFNGNPLMRYDGYYIFSDLIEIPNLARRANEYLAYLVKRYAWSIRNPVSPASTPGERAWMLAYFFSSGIYRFTLYIAIVLFILDQRFVLGAALLAFIGAVWVLMPAGRLVRYLASSPEIGRVRRRAVATTALAGLAVAGAVGLVPLPDHVRIEGVVEPAEVTEIYAQSTGSIVSVAPSGSPVGPDSGASLVAAESDALRTRTAVLDAELRVLLTARRMALTQDPAEVQRLDEQIAAVEDQRRWIEAVLNDLVVTAPSAGVWIAPGIDRRVGTLMRRGERLGVVADTSALIVRATADQRAAAAIIAEARPSVEVRPRGRPWVLLTGSIEGVQPAAQMVLPSPALAYSAGGEVETIDDDTRQTQRTTEPLFEIRISLDGSAGVRPGQRVVTRVRLADRTAAAMLWRSVTQVLQERFRI